MIKDCYDKSIFEDERAPFRTLTFESTEFFVYIPLTKKTYRKTEPDIFWHMASLSIDECEEQDNGSGEAEESGKGDMLLCANTNHQLSCLFECKKRTNTLPDGRVPCPFRAESIRLLPELINKYKEGDGLLKSWTYGNKLYIRCYIGSCDYVAIFKMTNSDYRGKKVLFLITAFPIVLYSSKRRFSRQYQEYLDN